MKEWFSHLCLRMSQSVTELDLQLLQLTDASSDVNARARKGSFRSVFSCFLCFSSVIFSIMFFSLKSLTLSFSGGENGQSSFDGWHLQSK